MNAFSKATFVIGLIALCAFPAAAQKETSAQATALMAKAQAQAKKESKAIFVVFDASW